MPALQSETLFDSASTSTPVIVRVNNSEKWTSSFSRLYDALSKIRAEVTAPVVIVPAEDTTTLKSVTSHFANLFGWAVNTDDELRNSPVYDYLLSVSDGEVTTAVQPTLF